MSIFLKSCITLVSKHQLSGSWGTQGTVDKIPWVAIEGVTKS